MPKTAPAKCAEENLPRPRSHKRIWAFRIVAATIIPAIFLCTLEVGLRIAGYGFDCSFFVPVEGRSQECGNPRFGHRFFSPTLARMPSPFVLDQEKSGDTYRIFVLGSSAAQGFPDPSFSFARILEAMLREAYPSAKFEVINTAMVAVNSHVVLQVARDCAARQPDLFIVYEGNNEIVGPYGPGTVFSAFSDRLWAIRARLALARWRLFQFTNNALAAVFASEEPSGEWKGMEFFLERPVAIDDTRLATTYDHFRENLLDICDEGREAGANVLLCTVGVNLRDCPPFASAHRRDLDASASKSWDGFYRQGVQHESEGDSAAALRAYDNAAAIDDRHAELQFRMARLLLAAGRNEDAAKRFSLARDLDTLRFRTDSRENEIIREVAATHGKPVRLVDIEKLMAADERSNGIPGHDLFYEHCHMNFRGNYLIARALFEALTPQLPDIKGLSKNAAAVCSMQRCMERLAYTPHGQHESLKAISGLFDRPPFSTMLNIEQQRLIISERLKKLVLEQTPASFESACRVFDEALALAPDDAEIRRNYAALLSAGGRFVDAEQQLLKVAEAFPFDANALCELATATRKAGRREEAASRFRSAAELSYCDQACQANVQFNLGLIAADANRMDDAQAHYEAALRLRPARSDVRTNLGQILLKKGEANAALGHFQFAVDRVPENPTYRINLASAQAYFNKKAEAIATLRKAAADLPTHPVTHSSLIDYLMQTGLVDEAAAHAEFAVKLIPDSADLRFKWASVLQKKTRTTEAIEQLHEALRINPQQARARQMLEQLVTKNGSNP